ncbi:hypothetical protein DITRI_Ditri17bG0018800 [Diplodiscus trichospermus]
MLAFGVRFDDRVTGKLEAFASRAKIVHIDIDSAKIGKNKQPHVSELNKQKLKYPLSYKTFGEAIPDQYAIQVLDELTNGNAIISTVVGRHQMWAAQLYKYKKALSMVDIRGHLGMVVQWEDRFYRANRAHTYLGDPSNEFEIFPNMLKFAEACGIPAVRVTRKEDLRAAIQQMLDTPGPYLLDVVVPHQEHVLPMIPSGGAFKDMITEGDGRTQY